MKAVMVMFDSLNRHMLSAYGCDWTHTPNFARLARRTVMFERSYVCSMPCMPARRELHTGRANFLHRAWGPLEPFDDSMPELLKKAGIHTHLATDHYHYFEDGGATYHTKYSTWEFSRGQEGDPWMGQKAPPAMPERAAGRDGLWGMQDQINRLFMRREEDQPQPRTFRSGLDFLRRNHAEDGWFLQIETFDPHEPFFSQQKYKDLFAAHYDQYKGRQFDWPPYRGVRETLEEVEHVRYEYAALLAMCDAYLGEVLKAMDELDLWKDTMLIVCTDHGFMLGEHECWAKIWQPFYEEIARTPLFIWDPRCGKAGERRQALVQMIDWAPTLLEYFGVPIPPDMRGTALRGAIAADQPVREAGIFGVFAGQVNVTDGRYVYMRAPVNPQQQVLYEYTLMPTRMRGPFSVEELRGNIELSEPLAFTKGVRPMKICEKNSWLYAQSPREIEKTLLFDVQSDPGQLHPLQDSRIERRMIEHLVRQMRAADAPREQFVRLGLDV